MKARRPDPIPPALIAFLPALTREEAALARRIAFDLYPERFLAQLGTIQRDILTQALLMNWAPNRISIMGARDFDLVCDAFRAALQAVEKVHA